MVEINKVYNENCLETMSRMPDNSVDAIVTDPPYGLSFMGKKWDYDVPGVEIWKECLRVLKPGGHLLSFAGTRTQHRMAVNIEDAGFEIRDMIAWVYGSGFPKSLNVSKAIDKRKDWTLVENLAREIKRARNSVNLSLKEIGGKMMDYTKGQYGKWYHRGGHMFFETGKNLPSRPEWELLKEILPIQKEFLSVYEEAEREIIGNKITNKTVYQAIGEKNTSGEIDITAPSTPEAQQWNGWGTALKPALEPITMARKPLSEKTIAANVLKWGTGAININECRVETNEELGRDQKEGPMPPKYGFNNNSMGNKFQSGNPLGRFPANFIHDGSEDVEALFPESKGQQGDLKGHDKKRKSPNGIFNEMPSANDHIKRNDSGSASRFFYTAKSSKSDRNDEGAFNLFEQRKPTNNNHPTVKPTLLMQYLITLVTPNGGIVYDPFFGSGTTGKAATILGVNWIGSELEKESCEIAEARIKACKMI